MSPAYIIATGALAILTIIILIARFRFEPIMTLFGVAILVGLLEHNPISLVHIRRR
ncbi:hypothetical protein [Acetobacter fallax]|uniref:Uncharacterized protein n=1 Tax=Acetobacter fallax TaxID=1737473 RepID=A0ABX0KKD8_9PROT|nr:hypothetical protein [Acetobacter fallax]NHO34337.1 hypothetical protein [Acetobacter fallax]NHO37906.1 hypothetical protein [Acetobacter fallax]